jgi:Protein of unknown function (DUF1244)
MHPSTTTLSTSDPPHKVLHPLILQQKQQQLLRSESMTTASTALEKLQAGAFRSLIQHLQDHASEISNIDLMSTAGFCRNCLAKVRQHAFVVLYIFKLSRTWI